MAKPLFDNVGKELKSLAEGMALYIKIIYGLIALAVLAAGIAISALSDSASGAVIAIFLSFIIFAIGCFIAKLQVIRLYAYGELVEKVTAIETILKPEKVTAKKNRINVNTQKAPGYETVNDLQDATYDDSIKGPKVERKADQTWQCPFCEYVNPAGTDWCEKCGVQVEL